ncbi:MAG: hypothetical protein ACRQFF_09680 [Sphaerochaeta sp.]
MKKFLLTALVLSVITVSSLVAETFTITLNAYVPEKVSFEQTADGYQVNSNSDSVEYGFYDAQGNETDAYGAKTFNVVAS